MDKKENYFKKPRIILLDGASASGKSTFKNKLLHDKRFKFEYIKRFTTREERNDDIINNDYIFISIDEFNKLQYSNELLEYRHFLFGMSYGIGIRPIVNAINSGNNALGLMNIGNVPAVKKIFPDAICVFIDSPIEDIKYRLSKRDWHSADQINERLKNALEAKSFAKEYDIVINNTNGNLCENFEVLVRKLSDFGVNIESC